MELTKRDKTYLSRVGYLEEDFPQIQRGLNDVKIYLNYDEEKELTREEAIRVLGKRCFLSGVARAAFDSSSVRLNKTEKNHIYFDLSLWW